MPISDNTEDYIQFFHRGKESTRHVNALRFKYYCQRLRKTPQKLIEEYEQAKEATDLKAWERRQINRITKFYNWLLESEKKSINHARSCAIATLAFYKQNCQQLEDVVKEFAPPQMATDEYRFTQDDLRKMFHFADVEGKALLSLAVAYGQGSKEFLSLECQELRSVINEARDKGSDFPHWIGRARSKTSVQPISFLTPEAIESLDEYLILLEKKHTKLPKYLWCNSKPDKHISNEGLNKKLRRLVAKANIKTYDKRVHFHLLRKFTFSRLRRIDRDIAKVICAKKVSASDMTYEEIEQQCEKVFRLAYKDISLNGDVTGKAKREQRERIKDLENAITTLSRELSGYRTTSNVLSEKVSALDEQVKKLLTLAEILSLKLEAKQKKRP